MGKRNGKVLDIAVEFGGVSIGKATARLGLSFDRNNCSLEDADTAFCGHRLAGRVVLGGKGDSPGQKKFVETHQVGGTFDVKRIGVNATSISTGLTFSLGDVDIQELAKFSKGSGRLIINEVGDIPDDAPDEDDDERQPLAGTFKCDGDWREYPLSKMFEGALLKALKKAGLTTMGQLAEFTDSDKRLTSIDGISPGRLTKIQEVSMRFWSDNPDADKPSEQAAAK